MTRWLDPVVLAVIRKELREYRQHRMILLTAILLPVALTALPMANLVLMKPTFDPDDVRFAVGQAVFCFFMTPIILPAVMASYSVVGERDQGTLEPLLTLPITERQLLIAKVVSIATPALIMSWASFGGYILLALALVDEPARSFALDRQWMVGVLGLAPALAVYSTLVGMTMSTRAKDVRVAEHLGGLVLLPSALPFLLVTARVIPPSLVTWGVMFLVVASLDGFLAWFIRRVFDRERLVAAT